MNVLFGVNSEGMGHAMRSAEMIKMLKEDFSVKVLAGGRAESYLRKVGKVYGIPYFRFSVKKGKVKIFETFFVNLFRFPLLLYSFVVLFFSCLKNRPDVIVSDFEPLSAYTGFLLRIPVIGFDNQHIITDTRIPKVGGLRVFIYKIIVHLMCPFPRRKIITGFFFPENLKKNSVLVPPIVRERISAEKISKGKNVLVYFGFENDEILDLLESLKVVCIFYGKTNKKEGKYLKKRNFSVEKFAEDFAKARAVVSNAGMTTIGEACYLNKPILCFPLNGQTEQEVNGHYVSERGFGKSLDEADRRKVKSFFDNLAEYEENLKKFRFSNKDAYNELKNSIEVLGKLR